MTTTDQADARLPLAGIRVIDAATVIAAPYSACILGEFGAEDDDRLPRESRHPFTPPEVTPWMKLRCRKM